MEEGQPSLPRSRVSVKFLVKIYSHFTSSVCLCVGYKMKTCTQISDSGFRRKINVVNPSD